LPEQVFAAVTEETAATFHASTMVLRFEHDPPGVVVAGVLEEAGVPVGTRWPLLAEGMASAEGYRTGRTARGSTGAEFWSSHSGPVAETARGVEAVSQVSVPVIVEGRVWGALAMSAREELPLHTEDRLERFADLVTAAIANAEARVALRTTADE